ncbi:hypothetical protein [Puia sp.]|uniref:hypothetical protein n=1 Tax=Puia sp. TaxID=2045100 RepID=UPI002F424F0A
MKLRPNTKVGDMEKKLPAFLDKYGQKQLKELGMKKELHLEPIGRQLSSLLSFGLPGDKGDQGEFHQPDLGDGDHAVEDH